MQQILPTASFWQSTYDLCLFPIILSLHTVISPQSSASSFVTQAVSLFLRYHWTALGVLLQVHACVCCIQWVIKSPKLWRLIDNYVTHYSVAPHCLDWRLNRIKYIFIKHEEGVEKILVASIKAVHKVLQCLSFSPREGLLQLFEWCS